ncbi:MAG: hypothetical protein LBK69_02760, partial [Syntrophomonadaceae bacterium]|nr:hypothetical protein [Syntrophomonadaceae bacterium]
MLWLKAESLKWICLTGAMTLITAGYYLLRNNFWGARYLTAQRVKFAAGSYLELKTRNYDIKYTEYDYENIVEIANTAEVAYD